jgi:hypothetical protein
MTEKLFERALGISLPWYVAGVEFDEAARRLRIQIDFTVGSRFAVAEVQGVRPVHDTVSKRYRHLNFFQYECELEVRVPRVKLPDGAVRQVEAPWAGKLSGFTFAGRLLVRRGGQNENRDFIRRFSWRYNPARVRLSRERSRAHIFLSAQWSCSGRP